MSAPPLRFHHAWAKAVSEQCGSSPDFKSIDSLKLQNVVMHVSTSQNAHHLRRRLAMGGHCGSRKGPGWSKHRLSAMSSTNLESPFQNISLRFSGYQGRYLEFPRECNAIRAGKNTHGDAVLVITKYQRFRNYPHFSSLNSPNTVISGSFRYRLDGAVKLDPQMSFTKKFPGIAFISDVESKCTPELYTGRNERLNRQKRSSVIFPGVGSAAEFLKVAMEVDKKVLKYSEKYDRKLLSPDSPEPESDSELGSALE